VTERDALFGTTVFQTSIPAVVKEADLAPFAELVWVTQPTAQERDWLAESALRFAELTTDLLDRESGTVPLLTWLERRFATAAAGAKRANWPGARTWTSITCATPAHPWRARKAPASPS